MKFIIPGELPDLNKIIKASKSHYMAYSNLKKDYTALVQMSAGNIPKIDSGHFEITWYCKDKRKDPDNIASGMKFIFDGLVKMGKLENDGWKQVKSIYHKFEIDKGDPRVEVTITEMSEKDEIS